MSPNVFVWGRMWAGSLGTVTMVAPQEAAGVCGSGQQNLKVHLLQDPLIQLDLCVGQQMLTQQDHGPTVDRKGLRLDLRTGAEAPELPS